MSITITARDANQRFAEILGKAAAGETVIITRRGEPVAQLTPYRLQALSPERKAALERLLTRWEKGVAAGVSKEEVRNWRFNRDWAHER